MIITKVQRLPLIVIIFWGIKGNIYSVREQNFSKKITFLSPWYTYVCSDPVKLHHEIQFAKGELRITDIIFCHFGAFFALLPH